jgi:hypothetical protein
VSLILINSYQFGGTPGFSTITDSFNRANNGATLGTADTGQAWTNQVGVLGVNSNTCYPATLSANEALATLDSTITDVKVKLTPTTMSTAGRFASVVGRYADNNNYYLAQTDTSNSQLYKRVAGTYTQLGSDAAAVAAGTVLELRCVGSTISLWGNGVELVSVTDTDLTAGTNCGVRVGGAGSTVLRMDTFSVEAG